ncbi:MAG: hypothetical protein ABIO70_35975 [Pseudomonadota bacterium]
MDCSELEATKFRIAVAKAEYGADEIRLMAGKRKAEAQRAFESYRGDGVVLATCVQIRS